MSRYYLGFDPGVPGDDYSAWCVVAYRAGHWTVIACGLGEYVRGESPFLTEFL